MSSNRFLPRELFLAGVLLAAAGCSSPAEEAEPGDAVIVSFEAAPSTIAQGASATLRWEVGGAAGLGIADETGATIELGPAELTARQVEVRPAQTLRYVLSATGRNGRVVSREVRVAVRAGQPEILSFTGTPQSLRAGQSATLSWATRNVQQVRIVGDDGAEVALGSASPADGTAAVRPARTTTYRLYASSATATVEAKVVIEVVAGLDVELIPDRPSIVFGEKTALRWRSRGAERVVVRAGAQVLVDGATTSSGSVQVSPVVTTAYRVEASAGAESAEGSATVIVTPAIDAFAATTQGPFARGADVELRWSVRGAETLRITSAGGFSFDADPAALGEGSLTAAIPADGRFDLEATLGDEKVARVVKLPLLDPPAVVSFQAAPGVVTVPEGGTADVTLSWSTARAAGIEIALQGGDVVFSSTAATGSTLVSIDRDAVFVLTARNDAGAATREAAVRAFAPPVIDRFVARPAHAGMGEAFELAWNTRGAASVALEESGRTIHAGPGGTGTFSTQLASPATFRLRAVNGAGAIETRSVAVSVGPPSIVSFAADRTRNGPGSTVHLSWTNLGGTSLTVQGPDGLPIAACTTSDLERIPAGDCAVLLPSTLGVRTYTLVLANGLAQQDVSSIDLEIVDGPTLFDFYAEDTRITLGDATTFHWTAAADGSGSVPTLSLADGADVYPLGSADPLAGSASVTPLRAGARTFRLTASTPGTTPTVREFALEVLEAPTLTVNASSTTYAPDAGPITISWQAAHASRLDVVEVDGFGATTIASYVDPVLIASGRIDVQPAAPGRTYRFVAANGAGGAVVREVAVTWVRPEIVDFSATPADVGVRGISFVQWVTSGASAVAIAPSPVVEADPFVDLAVSPTAIELPLEDCGAALMPEDGCVDVILPFGFPYGGRLRNQARVYLHGVLGFDMTYQGASGVNAALPSAAAPFVDLAPFWQALRASIPGAVRTGRILYEAGTGPRGQFAVIQWSGFWVAAATAAQPVALDFEIVLHESGDFDFRYGNMTGIAEWTNGLHASIGHQSQSGSAGRSISFEQAIPGGLGGLSLGFRVAPLPASGSLPMVQIFPGATNYTLTASNLAGAATATASVTAHPRVSLSGVRVVDAFPLPNTPFSVAWTSSNAAEVRVERPQADPTDPIVVLCSALPAQGQQCSLQEPSTGVYHYVVRALGRGIGDEQTIALDVEVFPPFSIDSFTATPATVTEGDDVTLSWTTTNADSLALTANGVAVDIAAIPRASGSVTVEVDVDTTFVLTAQSRGRTLTETRSVTAEPPPPPPPPPEEE